MQPITEEDLKSLLLPDARLSLLEPHIHTVLSSQEAASSYDSDFGLIYDLVACSPIYNRLVWGYSTSLFPAMAQEVLQAGKGQRVLDLGCGSLAFTAGTYARNVDCTVVLMDQSIKMLKLAKSRMEKLCGGVPENMVFLQGDARRLPFRADSFAVVLAQNLLHCLDDTASFLADLKTVAADGARMYFTTLVKSGRLADRYLLALANAGKLVPRDLDQHRSIFERLGLSVRYRVQGNLAAIISPS